MRNTYPTVPSQEFRDKVTTFLNKFTLAERGAIWNHMQTPTNDLSQHISNMKLSGSSFETDPAVIEALNKAVTAALVTNARKDTILNVEI